MRYGTAAVTNACILYVTYTYSMTFAHFSGHKIPNLDGGHEAYSLNIFQHFKTQLIFKEFSFFINNLMSSMNFFNLFFSAHLLNEVH